MRCELFSGRPYISCAARHINADFEAAQRFLLLKLALERTTLPSAPLLSLVWSSATLHLDDARTRGSLPRGEVQFAVSLPRFDDIYSVRCRHVVAAGGTAMNTAGIGG